MSELSRIAERKIEQISDLLSSADSLAVAIPDNTRPLPYEQVMPPLLKKTEDAGIDTTVVVGNGLHRDMTDEELHPVRALCDRTGVRLVQHDADDPDEIVQLDTDVSSGREGWPRLPATVNRHLLRADRVLSIGTVEPHQYAGFSGGAKGIAIGCGGEPTISAMHGLEFLRDDRTRLGSIDQNPFQAAIWALADWLDAPVGLQLVPATSQTSPSLHAGPLRHAFEAAVDVAQERFFSPQTKRYDWLELVVPTEKASNFYQASRAATYAGLVESPAVVRGGTLLVNAACPEGVGQGSGELACAEALARGRKALIEELTSDRTVQTRGGQQRAYVIAKTLESFDIALVGAHRRLEALEKVGIPQFDTTESARRALDLGPNGRTVHEIFHAVPHFQPESS